MTQTREERVAALESLLPLLEAHVDAHGRIVARAEWESTYEPPPPGWTPSPPEPDCHGACPSCSDFAAHRCTLREEAWAREWSRMRRAYPELEQLEVLLKELMYQHANWASALYWVYVQPWDGWERTRRHEWARLGIEWLADNFKGWLPTYVPPGLSAPDPADQKRRLIVVLRCQRGLSYSEIAKIVGCHRSYVGKVLAALKGH